MPTPDPSEALERAFQIIDEAMAIAPGTRADHERRIHALRLVQLTVIGLQAKTQKDHSVEAETAPVAA